MRKCMPWLRFWTIATGILLYGTATWAHEEADRIAKLSKVRGGLIVHYGCGDGRLTAALARNAAFVVQGLSPNAEQVHACREWLRTQQTPGSVAVRCWQESFLPYADNMVNLFVADGSGVPPWDEIMRVLTPLGVACVKQNGRWQKEVKPWPDEIDEWTHWLHGADGNPVAQDEQVAPPRAIQWAAAPRWPKSHDTAPSLTGMVSAQGRLFYIADIGPAGICDRDHDLEQWYLCARDAFNGVLLWKRPIEDWGNRAWNPGGLAWSHRKSSHSGGGPWMSNPRVIHKCLVAQGDSVYVTLGFRAPVSRLDAATGQVMQTYHATKATSEIVLHEGRLYLVVDRKRQDGGPGAEQASKAVVALDPESGHILWEKEGLHGVIDGKVRVNAGTIARLNVTAGGDKVYVYDREAIVALDAETGHECWRVPFAPSEAKPSKVWHPTDYVSDLLVSDGVLYSYREIPGKGLRIIVQALAADDGACLWQKTCGAAGFRSMVSIYKAQGLLWVLSDPEERMGNKRIYRLLGLDPRAGEVKKAYDIQNVMTSTHHHRCYRNKATENFIIYSRNGLEFADLRSGEINNNRWVRGMCGYGMMPANGLIFVPPQPCICFTNVRTSGFVTYAPQAETESPPVPDHQRLHKGPAYGDDVEVTGLTEADWSVYRHDAQRSGATPAQCPGKLETVWTRDLGEPITATTTGWGKVFVAGSRSYRVMALDGRTGRLAWAASVDHRVDTPPTLWQGKVYFGTTGGFVYCLRACDGALVWRFNANPRVKTIMVHGHLESAWPIHGSVVVHKGLVCFVAGRSTYVDGGLYCYALDAQSGRPRLFSRQDTSNEGAKQSGATLLGTYNDLLTFDGHKLYLRNLRFNPDTFQAEALSWPYTPFIKGPYEAKFVGAPLVSLGGGFLDNSLYDRSAYVLNQQQSARKLVYSADLMIGLRWSLFKKGRLFSHEGIFEVERDSYTVFARKQGFGEPDQWAKDVPIRVEAMALSANAIYVAGPPISREPEFVLRSINGQEGGRLMRLNRTDGDSTPVCRLACPPVWDGITVDRKGLYIALRDGKVMKLGANGKCQIR